MFETLVLVVLVLVLIALLLVTALGSSALTSYFIMFAIGKYAQTTPFTIKANSLFRECLDKKYAVIRGGLRNPIWIWTYKGKQWLKTEDGKRARQEIFLNWVEGKDLDTLGQYLKEDEEKVEQ